MSFLSWEHRFVEQRWKSEAGGGAASSCTELRWRCQVMPDRQVLRLVMPGRQVLRTTDPPRASSCVAGGTWQHGAEMYQWRPRRVQLFARREEVPLGAVVASTIA